MVSKLDPASNFTSIVMLNQSFADMSLESKANDLSLTTKKGNYVKGDEKEKSAENDLEKTLSKEIAVLTDFSESVVNLIVEYEGNSIFNIRNLFSNLIKTHIEAVPKEISKVRADIELYTSRDFDIPNILAHSNDYWKQILAQTFGVSVKDKSFLTYFERVFLVWKNKLTNGFKKFISEISKHDIKTWDLKHIEASSDYLFPLVKYILTCRETIPVERVILPRSVVQITAHNVFCCCFGTCCYKDKQKLLKSLAADLESSAKSKKISRKTPVVIEIV